MERELSQLVDDYESGRMTRRQLIAKIGAFVALFSGVGHLLEGEEASAQAPHAASPFKATELNHIALRVTDVPRSRDFYVKHLGMTIAREGPNDCFLNCGDNFVALFHGSRPAMDHYCYSVKDFDINTAAQKLKTMGINASVHGGSRIYFDDPDGLTVQLASETHVP
jgi:catechol 2,3-dioxygenase-like lactoylglutathione lyase family enzyme